MTRRKLITTLLTAPVAVAAAEAVPASPKFSRFLVPETCYWHEAKGFKGWHRGYKGFHMMWFKDLPSDFKIPEGWRPISGKILWDELRDAEIACKAEWETKNPGSIWQGKVRPKNRPI